MIQNTPPRIRISQQAQVQVCSLWRCGHGSPETARRHEHRSLAAWLLGCLPLFTIAIIVVLELLFGGEELMQDMETLSGDIDHTSRHNHLHRVRTRQLGFKLEV